MIIGIMGFIGSGKGTVGDILSKEYGFQKMAFADPLKDATSAIFGWKREWLEGDTKESREWREHPDEFWSEALDRPGFTPRLALQLMGTEAGRLVFGDTLWISATKARIDMISKGLTKDFVITDVRFPNEIDAIKAWGGHVYRVKRGPEPVFYKTAMVQNTTPSRHHHINESSGRTMEAKFPDVHISEWAWIGHPYDGDIENDGTINDLRERVQNILISYAKKDLHSA